MDQYENVPRTVPSREDWSRLRPIVVELYHQRRWTMEQVCKHVRSLGYQLTTRMIRGRISQWNLQRNNQMRDMIQALRLLPPESGFWPTSNPVFLIRERQVSLSEVLQFFRRRGIQNPLQWVREVPLDPDESNNVTLLDSSSAGADQHGMRLIHQERDFSGRQIALQSDRSDLEISGNQSVVLAGGSMPSSGRPIQIFPFDQRAVQHWRDYCLACIGSDCMNTLPEPDVHQFTTHGRFGDRMQEGIAQLVRGGSGAFPSFRRGFGLVGDLLGDHNPISIALFLAVVCELASHTGISQSVLRSLIRHTLAMASSLRVHGSLIRFLESLSDSDALTTTIFSLRAAVGLFSESYPSTWHSLYIQERLCDCLYHGMERTEGSARRLRLLQDQEAYYGQSARNVLWTVTNVADDHLRAGNIGGGQEYYAEALTRAQLLNGFGRAKIRFAALEGLGRTEEMRSQQSSQNSAPSHQDAINDSLSNAYRYYVEALNEAQKWFEPSSRRLSRVRDRLESLHNYSGGMKFDMVPATGLSNTDLLVKDAFSLEPSSE